MVYQYMVQSSYGLVAWFGFLRFHFFSMLFSSVYLLFTNVICAGLPASGQLRNVERDILLLELRTRFVCLIIWCSWYMPQKRCVFWSAWVVILTVNSWHILPIDQPKRNPNAMDMDSKKSNPIKLGCYENKSRPLNWTYFNRCCKYDGFMLTITTIQTREIFTLAYFGFRSTGKNTKKFLIQYLVWVHIRKSSNMVLANCPPTVEVKNTKINKNKTKEQRKNGSRNRKKE